VRVGKLSFPQPPTRKNATRSMDKLAVRTGEVGSERDHYSALAELVAEVSQDQAHLRTFIYEFARVKLRKDLYPLFVEGAWSEIEEQVQGLEAAINRIEADLTDNAPSLQFSPRPALTDGTGGQSALHSGSQVTSRFGQEGIPAHSLLVRPPSYRMSSLPALSDGNDRLANAYLGKHLRSTFWRNTQLIAAAIIGIVIFAVYDAKSFLDRVGMRGADAPAEISSTNNIGKEKNVAVGESQSLAKSDELPPKRPSDMPIPSEYGAYAVVNGRLTELEQLPIKVPDPRIAISATISMPSRTHLPMGRFQFVVFRRDLMNNAPDRVTVRVVARVMRALTFDKAGIPNTTNVEQSWVIRNNSYEMRVGPFADNPEMIVIRPDQPDFALPSGRYALVLKGVGYDFTVDGATDPAHCLERTDALNAPIYSECRKL
jgi:hypothetical protein